MAMGEGIQDPFVSVVRLKGHNYVLVTIACEFFFYQEESSLVVVGCLSRLFLHVHQIPDVRKIRIVWGICYMGVGGRKFRISPGRVSGTLTSVSATPEAPDVLDPA